MLKTKGLLFVCGLLIACGGGELDNPWSALGGKSEEDNRQAPSECFEYDYVFPQSSTQLIPMKELVSRERMTPILDVEELWDARNEIYARNGRPFQTAEGQQRFPKKVCGAKDWTGLLQLNEIELSNIYAIQFVEALLEKGADALGSESGKMVLPDILIVRDCPSKHCEIVKRIERKDDDSCFVTPYPALDIELAGQNWSFVVSEYCYGSGTKTPVLGYVLASDLGVIAG